MRRFFLRVLAIFAIFIWGSHVGFAGESTEATAELRILSYNVRNAMGIDRVTDPDRTAQVIRDVNPDFVMVQELDCKTQRSGGMDRLAELAERTEMVATFGPAIEFQGGQYGVGLLSKEKPLRSRTVPLPGREERRALLIVEFSEYVCFCTHFSLTPEDRLASVEIIAEEREKYDEIPIFLAGDFNAEPEETPIVELKKDWKLLSVDAPTFPADRPTVQIDYVFGAHLPESVQVVESRVLDASTQSDHRPVLVVLRHTKVEEESP